jgi:hypothetical protein
MAPIIPLVEPTLATSGSTWKWTTASAAYPVSEGWALSYVIAGVRSLVWSTGYVANDGTTHTITIPPAATLPLLTGRYEITRVWTGSGTYSGVRYTEALPALTVLPDPATVQDGDRVTFAETNLAAVEAALTARLAGDQPEEYSIGGRSVKKISIPELRSMRTALQAELWKARNPGVVRQRSVRFTVPCA